MNKYQIGYNHLQIIAMFVTWTIMSPNSWFVISVTSTFAIPTVVASKQYLKVSGIARIVSLKWKNKKEEKSRLQKDAAKQGY